MAAVYYPVPVCSPLCAGVGLWQRETWLQFAHCCLTISRQMTLLPLSVLFSLWLPECSQEKSVGILQQEKWQRTLRLMIIIPTLTTPQLLWVKMYGLFIITQWYFPLRVLFDKALGKSTFLVQENHTGKYISAKISVAKSSVNLSF